MQTAMRRKLLELVVATTANDAMLAATATGYTRTDGGSFITERFAPGMEIVPTGFTGATRQVIAKVTVNQLVVAGPVIPDTVLAGRSISVGLPAIRLWEDISVPPSPGYPYVEEQYVPGPAEVVERGVVRTEVRPMYTPRVYVPLVVAGVQVGNAGDGMYADAILELFPSGSVLPCDDGTVLCVRGSPAPTRFQRSYAAVGWSCIPITIPFYTL